MKKILHTAKYEGEPLEILKSIVPGGFEIETLEEPSKDCLKYQASDADYFLVSGRLKIDEDI